MKAIDERGSDQTRNTLQLEIEKRRQDRARSTQKGAHSGIWAGWGLVTWAVRDGTTAEGLSLREGDNNEDEKGGKSICRRAGVKPRLKPEGSRTFPNMMEGNKSVPFKVK